MNCQQRGRCISHHTLQRMYLISFKDNITYCNHKIQITSIIWKLRIALFSYNFVKMYASSACTQLNSLFDTVCNFSKLCIFIKIVDILFIVLPELICVCRLLFIDFILDCTPHEKINWCQIQRSGRSLNGINHFTRKVSFKKE